MNVSRLDYFMAHAPAEPQPWFQPSMPPAPEPFKSIDNQTDAERNELDGYGDWLALKHLKEPRVIQYVTAMDAYNKARQAWEVEHKKQRYIQWPRAWALAVMKTVQS